MNAASPHTRIAKSAKVSDVSTATTSRILECPLNFVCVPRPFWDFMLENEDEEDENADILREKMSKMLKEARKTWLKPAGEFPGYTWTVR